MQVPRIGMNENDITFMRWLDDYSHAYELKFDYRIATFECDLFDRTDRLMARARFNQKTGEVSVLTLATET